MSRSAKIGIAIVVGGGTLISCGNPPPEKPADQAPSTQPPTTQPPSYLLPAGKPSELNQSFFARVVKRDLGDGSGKPPSLSAWTPS
jgi:hypothetical protein